MKTVIRRVLIVLVGCFCLLLSPPVQAYEVAKEHPRIWVRAKDLPELARRCGPGGPFAEEYQAMKTAVDEYVDTNSKANLGHWLPEIPLVYLVEKSLGHDASRYSDFLRKEVWGTDGRGAGTSDEKEEDEKKRRFRGGMYDAFTPQERKVYAEVLGPWLCNRGWMRGPSGSPAIHLEPGIDNYWYNQTWGSCYRYVFGNYYMRQGVGPKVLVALAIYGEGTKYDEHAKVFLDSFDEQMREGFLPALNARGGIPTEGPYHGGMLTSPAVALEAYRSATGENLFKMLGRHGLLAETPLWYAYTSMPHNGAMGYIDDASPGMNKGMEDVVRVMPLIAHRFGQPVGQFYALEHFNSRPKMTSKLGWYGRDGWADILWLDPEAPATTLKQLPLTYHFPGNGHVYMRSTWDDPDTTWAFFGAGDRIVSCWGSDDEGSFQIFKGGPLATPRSRGASIWHNIVLIYDPDEPTGDRPSDGGHRTWYLEERAGTRPQAAGKVVAYEHHPEYTYVCADLADAYYSGKLRAYRRHFLYLRSEPECFIVYDRVEATKPEFPKTWLMYVMNEPQVLKGETPAEPTDSPHAGCRVFEASADSIYVTNYTPEHNPKTLQSRSFPFESSGFGTMVVKVLLPERVRVTVRGGPDYGRWGNPHAPAGEPKADPKLQYGRWRIEEEPVEQDEVTEFLNVLIPKLVPDSGADKALTREGLEFPKAELIERDGKRIRLRVTSARGRWEIELPRSTDSVGSVKRLGADGEKVEFSHDLTTKVEENGEIPGYSWNPTNGPR